MVPPHPQPQRQCQSSFQGEKYRLNSVFYVFLDFLNVFVFNFRFLGILCHKWSAPIPGVNVKVPFGEKCTENNIFKKLKN